MLKSNSNSFEVFKRCCGRSLGLTSAGHGTLLAGFVPGTANVVGAAAHLLGHVEIELAVARLVVGVEVPVAVALPHVCTAKKRSHDKDKPNALFLDLSRCFSNDYFAQVVLFLIFFSFYPAHKYLYFLQLEVFKT